MAHIDYYFGTASSWSYLAGLRLEAIAAEHGATITYKPLDLQALFLRTGGQRPQDRHPSKQAYRLQEMQRWSEALGMEMNLKPDFWPVNPAPAAYVIIAAQAKGINVAQLSHAVLRAVWAENRNIADDDTLRAILTEQGMNPSIVDTGLLVGAETYSRNLEEAVNAGAFGAPFYIIRETGESFWGQDRLEFLDKALAKL